MRLLILLHVSCLLIAWLFVLPHADLPAEEIDFNRDVRPILAQNCYECHGPDKESRQADLRLDILDDVLESAIVPGRPDASTLIERLLSKDPDMVMPPPDSKRRPTAQQIETLRKWVEQGAKYEPHWAFVAPTRPAVPSVSQPVWTRNAIDAFALEHLESQSLKPRADASPRVLARRLSLALTGLPVLPKRSDRFVEEYQNDAEKAIFDFVDELLASESYGEHMAWGWLDAARYADTNGYQGDGVRIMWPWRDWLVRNLNENLPFDQMTEQMLAGDLLLPKSQQSWKSADWIDDDRSSELLKATGFLRNHRYDTGSGTIPAESNFENSADRMETVGTVWMGMTMLCARCHTHKYDPIENREYYELLSFFDKVPEVGSALKGASHPYIHTPTIEQRAKLHRLHIAKAKAETAFAAAVEQIERAQSQWEQQLATETTISKQTQPRVARGLRFRFADESLQFSGKNSIEKTNKPVALCAGNKWWSISFWFRPESNADGAIFSSVEEPHRYRPGIQADWVGGRIRVRHVCRWVNSYIEFESSEKLKANQWHHITFCCDGRMQGLAYSASLNGSDDSMLCTHAVTNDSAGNSGKAPLVLGGSSLLQGVVGKLRDLCFYDRLLELGEVRSLADPRSTVEIARIPAGRRTKEEAKILRLAFLESDALPNELQKQRDDVLSTTGQLAEAIRETPTTMVMKDTALPTTRIRKAGVFDSLGEQVETDTPEFLPPLTDGPRNRLALARWLMRLDHPLTARVAVNRIWQTVWGRGFVDSPENFGRQCTKPIHAEMLDWLATEYIRLGWDTKALIKTIVTSRVYRQSSIAPDELWKRDPQNRHLARGPRFRLPIHAVRDSALFLSGRLDHTPGGPPVVLDEVRGKDGKPMATPFQQSNRRRTLYTFWKRNSPHPLLAVFDVADRNQCEVRTIRTNTPLQTLVTLNEAGFTQCAKDLGRRARTAAFTEAEQLQWLWLACTGRMPDEGDSKFLSKTLYDYRDLSGDEELAWTALANVVLNLDAALTLE